MIQVQENTFIVEVGVLLNNSPSIVEAYNFTYKRLYKSTHRYGMRLLNDAFTIDGLVQEAFLKLWDYREQMTSLLHVSRFLKQTVRWECYAHFRNPVSRFHRSFTFLDAIKDNDSLVELAEPAELECNEELSNRQLTLIDETMPFLPSGKTKTFLKRYYNDGLSGKQIAELYAINVNTVHSELRRGVTQLKAMIVQPQQLFGNTKTNNQRGKLNRQINIYHIEGLSTEQSQIYILRIESNYEFKQIAEHLALPQAYVQREYVKACKAFSLQKKKTGKAARLTGSVSKRTNYTNASALYLPQALPATFRTI